MTTKKAKAPFKVLEPSMKWYLCRRAYNFPEKHFDMFMVDLCEDEPEEYLDYLLIALKLKEGQKELIRQACEREVSYIEFLPFLGRFVDKLSFYLYMNETTLENEKKEFVDYILFRAIMSTIAEYTKAYKLNAVQVAQSKINFRAVYKWPETFH